MDDFYFLKFKLLYKRWDAPQLTMPEEQSLTGKARCFKINKTNRRLTPQSKSYIPTQNNPLKIKYHRPIL